MRAQAASVLLKMLLRYSIADDVLKMLDESGKPTGEEHRLAPG
jgi:hypothetical protein